MKNKEKSLKMFIEKASIKKEVEKWNDNDCLNYLKKHAKDKKQNRLLKKKIGIVFSCMKNKSLIKDKDTLESILENENVKNLITKDEDTLESILENENIKKSIEEDRKFRKLLLRNANISCDDLKKYFTNIPLDPKDVPVRVHDTGVYLWKRGYNVEKFLGAGGFGTVWECIGKGNKHKAVKVVNTNKSGIEEIKNADKLYSLFSEDKQAMKYFNLLKTKKDNSPILKAVLAKGDLFEETKNKTFRKAAEKKKKIDSILRNATQALKSVIKLHESGYSHNDIKLQNFLKIDSWESKKEKIEMYNNLKNQYLVFLKISDISNVNKKFKTLCDFLKQNKINNPKINSIKDSKELNVEEKVKQIEEILDKIMSKEKIHKHRVQLADFGTVSPIPESGDGLYCQTYSMGYVAKADEKYLGKNAPKEAIEKRDVYALGVVFRQLLYMVKSVEEKFTPIKTMTPDPEKIKDTDTYKFLKKVYSGERSNRMAGFIALIVRMLDENYTTRISLEEALNEIKKIKSSKQI